jgi:hypothetical protein
MRKFKYFELKENSYEMNLFENSNKTLISNFNKVADWIKTNCPNLNGEFRCRNNPYYWIALVVEDGKAYLEYGSHGYGYDIAMSQTETATFSRGSMQSISYAYDGIQFFRNDGLEEFLKQWDAIKEMVIAENKSQSNVFSDDFVA